MFWPTYHNGTPILIGDAIRVYVPRFGVWHHGIVRLFYRTCNGVAVQIVHNDKTSGVSTIDWHDFASGNTIERHRRPSPDQVQAVLHRANTNIGKPYHLFGQNCEHFVAFALTGEATSETIQILGSAAAILVVIGIAQAD